MGDQTIQPTPASPEIIAFATRMYDAARLGDVPIFEQALPAGLPPNMTNDKGDSLVGSLFPEITNDLPYARAHFTINPYNIPPSPTNNPSAGTLLLTAHALNLPRSRSPLPSPPLSWC